MNVKFSSNYVNIDMPISEWNEILAAINHSIPFNADSSAKYARLIEFRETVQREIWASTVK